MNGPTASILPRFFILTLTGAVALAAVEKKFLAVLGDKIESIFKSLLKTGSVHGPPTGVALTDIERLPAVVPFLALTPNQYV